MCVICILPKGYTLPYEMFTNACYNNWHSYGVVLKENKKLQVIRDCPREGNDPQVIYKILKENEDVERYVHLRHTTVGETNLENTQPFTVFYSDSRHVELMHNGTMHSINIPDFLAADIDPDDKFPKDASDTKQFATFLIQPLLARLAGRNGKADIHDPMFQHLVDKIWPTGNRGILISSDQKPLLLNQNGWVKVSDNEGKSFWASNNDYFDRLVRGPEYSRREALKRAQAEEERKKNQLLLPNANSNKPLIRLNNVEPIHSPTFERAYGIPENIRDAMEEYDLYQRDGYMKLANLTLTELDAIMEYTGHDFVYVVFQLLGYLKTDAEKALKAEEEAEKSESGRQRALKTIAKLKSQLAELNGNDVHVG